MKCEIIGLPRLSCQITAVCNLHCSSLHRVRGTTPRFYVNLGVVWTKIGLYGSVFAFGPKWFGDIWAEIPSGLVRFGLMI